MLRPLQCFVSALLLNTLSATNPAGAMLSHIQKDVNSLSIAPTYKNSASPNHVQILHTPRPPTAKPTEAAATATAATVPADFYKNSINSDSLYCRGSRALRNIINNLNRMDKPLVLMRGLEIVPVKPVGSSHQFSNGGGDDSFLSCLSDYLRSHELNIKFSDLLADESENYLTRDLGGNGNESLFAGFPQEARKKGKEQGIILAMAMMFGKMMAVMSLGGIGALAMKALGVAMTALMMAGLVGMKSLMKGGESSHSVQYLTGGEGYHHIRRRRSNSIRGGAVYDPLNLAYHGWRRQKQKMEGDGI